MLKVGVFAARGMQVSVPLEVRWLWVSLLMVPYVSLMIHIVFLVGVSSYVSVCPWL